MPSIELALCSSDEKRFLWESLSSLPPIDQQCPLEPLLELNLAIDRCGELRYHRWNRDAQEEPSFHQLSDIEWLGNSLSTGQFTEQDAYQLRVSLEESLLHDISIPNISTICCYFIEYVKQKQTESPWERETIDFLADFWWAQNEREVDIFKKVQKFGTYHTYHEWFPPYSESQIIERNKVAEDVRQYLSELNSFAQIYPRFRLPDGPDDPIHSMEDLEEASLKSSRRLTHYLFGKYVFLSVLEVSSKCITEFPHEPVWAEIVAEYTRLFRGVHVGDVDDSFVSYGLTHIDILYLTQEEKKQLFTRWLSELEDDSGEYNFLGFENIASSLIEFYLKNNDWDTASNVYFALVASGDPDRIMLEFRPFVEYAFKHDSIDTLLDLETELPMMLVLRQKKFADVEQVATHLNEDIQNTWESVAMIHAQRGDGYYLDYLFGRNFLVRLTSSNLEDIRHCINVIAHYPNESEKTGFSMSMYRRLKEYVDGYNRDTIEFSLLQLKLFVCCLIALYENNLWNTFWETSRIDT